MKAGTTISGVGLGLGMTAVGFATWGVLSTGTASAASAGTARTGSSDTSTATVTPTPTVTTVTPTVTVAPTVTVTPTVWPTAPVTPVPTVPPATGGGGTAGLQDAVLFGVGGVAVLAGSGSIIYRLRGKKQQQR
jgi:hypothetical protein